MEIVTESVMSGIDNTGEEISEIYTTEEVMSDIENTEAIDIRVVERDSGNSGEVVNVEDNDVDEIVVQDNINTDTDENINVQEMNKENRAETDVSEPRVRKRA